MVRPRGFEQRRQGNGIGLSLTLLYDVLTNLGTAWSLGAYRNPFPVLWGGLVFGAWHMVWNAALFAVGCPALLGVLRRREARAL